MEAPTTLSSRLAQRTPWIVALQALFQFPDKQREHNAKICRVVDFPGPHHYAEITDWLELAEELDTAVDLHLLANQADVPGIREDIMEEENHVGYDWEEVSGDEEHDAGDHGEEPTEVVLHGKRRYRARSAWLHPANRDEGFVVKFHVEMDTVDVILIVILVAAIVALVAEWKECWR